MTNAKKYAEQIATMIANSVEDRCSTFSSLEQLRCWKCSLKGNCNNAEKLKWWLLQEDENIINAEKYAKQIAQMIVVSKNLAVCKAFQGYDSGDCKGCPMQKLNCNNLKLVEAWLKEESDPHA